MSEFPKKTFMVSMALVVFATAVQGTSVIFGDPNTWTYSMLVLNACTVTLWAFMWRVRQ